MDFVGRVQQGFPLLSHFWSLFRKNFQWVQIFYKRVNWPFLEKGVLPPPAMPYQAESPVQSCDSEFNSKVCVKLND